MEHTKRSEEKTTTLRKEPAESAHVPHAAFIDAIRSVRRPLILGHITPDADCLGACLGLCVAMRGHGVTAFVGLPESGVPERLTFMLELAGSELRVSESSASDPYDAAIIVDTATEKRINSGAGIVLPDHVVRYNIDHHITNTDFAQHNWVDPHAGSTSEMIARLIHEMNWALSPAAASLLYAGIHGDTGGFSLPSTSAEALQTAADLVRRGADVSHIGERLCRSQGRRDFELLRRVYDHTTIVAGGRIAYSFLTHEDIEESGCKAEDIDDQVSIPRALKDVAIAMLFSEGEPGTVRINLRGEGRTTVVEIAQRFGGGGHAQSAGVRFRNRPMVEVIEMVVAAAQEHLGGPSGPHQS